MQEKTKRKETDGVDPETTESGGILFISEKDGAKSAQEVAEAFIKEYLYERMRSFYVD